MAENLLQASIYLYGSVVTKFLPTPTKIHYLFNLRDISKVNDEKLSFSYCSLQFFSFLTVFNVAVPAE